MKFKHHKYTYTKSFGQPVHMWQLVGPNGGIHYRSSESKDYGVSCGLELHGRGPFRCDEPSAPSDVNCWLIGGACWHDGTSLYAQETLWPMFKVWLQNGDHDMIFRSLEQEYEDRFEPKEGR